MARKMHIDNTPPSAVIKNLKILCTQILEPVRQRFGHPLTITSGFRCVKLNRIVGGQPNSYHLKGMAADIRISDFQSAKGLLSCSTNSSFATLFLWSVQGQAGSGFMCNFPEIPAIKLTSIIAYDFRRIEAKAELDFRSKT